MIKRFQFIDLHADTRPIDKKLHHVDVELLLEIANAGVIENGALMGQQVANFLASESPVVAHVHAAAHFFTAAMPRRVAICTPRIFRTARSVLDKSGDDPRILLVS